MKFGHNAKENEGSDQSISGKSDVKVKCDGEFWLSDVIVLGFLIMMYSFYFGY